MWKSNVGRTTAVNLVKPVVNTKDDDDWETDADFVNDVSEREQRWGAKTVKGSGRVDAINIDKLRDEVKKDSEEKKLKEYEQSQNNFSKGYGGKYGVQKDRLDKSAVGFEYQADLGKHASQKDYSQGFGGKFGVLTDRKDQSAVGFDHVENLQKHSSQVDHSKGFGGKFGVLTDRKDQSAVGFDHVENLSKHSSQVDHSKGFGGKFGVAQDRKDQSAVGFDHVESLSKHSSQVDYSKGFGGKYGINSDRKDQSAVGFDHVEKVQKHSSQVDHSKGFGGKFGVEKNMDKSACSFEEDSNHVVGTNYQRTRADSKTDIKDIKSKFENNAFINNDESKKRVEEIRAERMNIVKKEKEEEISRNNEIKKPGKININSAFLNNTQEQPIKQQPQITKPNKINFNRFNLNNNNNNNQKEEEPIKQEIIKPISVPDVDVIEYPQQMPSGPEEVKQPESAVNFNPPIGFNQTEYSNVDEWNDDDSPPKIIPTHAAKIEDQYQQEDIYENMDDDSYIQMPQPQVTKTQQPTTVGNSSSHGNKAIALYDFAASEPDELSFDPNDIIENIQILDEGWWQGTCKGRFGLFPSNYVQMLE